MKMIFKQSTILFGIHAEDERPINLISKAFTDNQRLISMFNRDLNPHKALKHLITYCYSMVKKENQVFISEDRNTFMLYYRKSRLQKNWADWLNYLYLALRVIGPKKLPAIYKREKLVSAIREKEMAKRGETDYFYIWFLAQNNKAGARDLFKAKSFIQTKADEMGLPVFLETTCPRLKRIYEKQGFKIYDSYIDESANVTVWFGRYRSQ